MDKSHNTAYSPSYLTISITILLVHITIGRLVYRSCFVYFTGACESCDLQVPVQGELSCRGSCIVTSFVNSAGKNLALIRELAGLNPWCASLVSIRSALISQEKVEVPPTDI